MGRTWTIGTLAVAAAVASAGSAQRAQPELGARSVKVLTVDGLRFRDLDHDGRLTPYEDWRLTPAARAADLVRRMTLEEKAGVMVHGTVPAVGSPFGAGAHYDIPGATPRIDKGVNTFITRLSGDPGTIAEENNRLQEIAERTRLGIPLVISTDPRHHFQETAGASTPAGGFSLFPELQGFAAVGDASLVRHFGDVVRLEYRAVGIHEALSPQADLATEPRWPRINGTFGEDAALARKLVQAYVQGVQGAAEGLAANGVITIVKHWVGYGAEKDGFDGHNFYGRFASLQGNSLASHIEPFRGAFDAGVAGVMPTYVILQGATLDGAPIEAVGAGFNKQLLSDLLRGQLGFKGIVVSDWAITNDCPAACQGNWSRDKPPSVGMPWGVETLARMERFAKAIDAGVDQIGGTEESEQIVAAVKAGRVTETRVTEAATRILGQRFVLGLFENPYVDPGYARRIVGAPGGRAAGVDAQRRSLVLLENKNGVLPIKVGARVFLEGVSADEARTHGLRVADAPAHADLAIIRTKAPYQTLHPSYFFGAMQHEGDLDFKESDPAYQSIVSIAAAVPTIVTVFLDRPAILSNLRDRVAGLVGNFGVSDEALLDVLTGKTRPAGKLPFELPSSMDEVRAQRPDLPHDTAHPLYPFGFGRAY